MEEGHSTKEMTWTFLLALMLFISISLQGCTANDPWRDWVMSGSSLIPSDSEVNSDYLIHLFRVINDPRNYSSAFRPHVGGQSDNITCNIIITSFGPISESKMDYTIDIDLQMQWEDPRLRSDLHKNFAYVTLPASEAVKLWVPDLFFTNEKSGRFHDVTLENRLAYIKPNGRLFYSVRITLTLFCPMMLSDFPFDRQRCSVQVESYGYPKTELAFMWAKKDPVQLLFLDKMELPQFILEKITTEDCTKKLKTGEFTCIQATFHLKRDLFYFFVQNYIPSILTVFISWIAFYLAIDSTIGRAAIGFTTNMTMLTQLATAQADLPKVNYAKSIDIYIAACIMMVFLATIQFAIVHQFARRSKDIDERKKRHEAAVKSGKSTSPYEPDVVHIFYWFPAPACFVDMWNDPKQSKAVAKQIDIVSRILFPFSFALFNVVYWPVFLLDY